jgi:hypothetical protein
MHKRRPILAAVFQTVKEGIGFTGKINSFRKLLHKMEFR